MYVSLCVCACMCVVYMWECTHIQRSEKDVQCLSLSLSIYPFNIGVFTDLRTYLFSARLEGQQAP